MSDIRQPFVHLIVPGSVRVIDGDTFSCLADQGFGNLHKARIRLAGINTPELKEPGGAEARQAVVTWLKDQGIPKEPRFTVATLLREREVRTFERWIGSVQDRLTGELLEDHLVAQGFAKRIK
jgi:endonuclease YncB( thermonuclease family)